MLHLSTAAERNSTAIAPWDRGFEMLPAAKLAVEEVNANPTLLPNCTLELLVIDIDDCVLAQFASNYKALVPFAEIASKPNNQVLGVVGGPFCPPLLIRFISPLASKKLTRLFELSGSTAATVREHNTDLSFITPSIELHYEAVYSLMTELNWTKVFVIAENFYQGATSVKGSEGLDITYRQLDSALPSLLSDLRDSQKNIIFASVSASHAAEILCQAQKELVVYPYYVWMFHDLSPALILSSSGDKCNMAALKMALNGTFFLKFPFKQSSPSTTLISGLDYSEYHSKYLSFLSDDLRPNPYANVLYDSVWAFALALNLSLTSFKQSPLRGGLRLEDKEKLIELMDKKLVNVSFEGASGSIDFSRRVVNDAVEISVHHNHSTTLVAVFHASSNLTLHKEALPSIPRDTLSRQYILIPTSLTIFLCVFLAACILLTTVILALHIYFRQDPDIKAASPHLSSLMFLGCYLLFAATLIHVVSGAMVITGTGIITICGAIITGGSLGLNLIFTTLLLRLLRVYRIFTLFGRTGKVWSNRNMAAVVGVVVFFDMLLILVWSLVDTFRHMDVVTFRPDLTPPHYQIHQYCSSTHLGVWLGLVLGKLGVLFLAVFSLAILTRKIHRSNFKDTKKVNIYIFSTMMVVVTHISLFFLFKSINNAIATHLMIYLAFSVTGLLCQVFLFVPKVISPILKRYGYEVTYEKTRGRKILSKRRQPRRPAVRARVMAVNPMAHLV